MKIERKDNLTIQIWDLYFPGEHPNTVGKDSWWGAPSPDAWWKMMEWARKNSIVCRRGRGTDVVFEREQDMTTFVLRWAYYD